MSTLTLPEDRRRRPAWQRLARLGGQSNRIRRVGVGGRIWLITAGVLVLGVLVLPSLLPHGTTEIVGVPLTGPSGAYPLGTDQQGYDLLTRVAYGARTSLTAAVIVIASGVIIGGLIGLVAGVAGGVVDSLLMRLTDLFLALPGPLLVLAVVSALGASLSHTVVGVMVVWWPWYARIVRGQVTATMALPHVEAARLGGLGRIRVAFKHVLPGSFSPLVVAASLDVGNAILLLASLSFLGLGSPDGTPELGAMTANGLTYLLTGWWVAAFPAIAVTLLALVGNFAGDTIRDLVAG